MSCDLRSTARALQNHLQQATVVHVSGLSGRSVQELADAPIWVWEVFSQDTILSLIRSLSRVAGSADGTVEYNFTEFD